MAQVFTDAQIEEILSLMKQHFAVAQYIGARYVPMFGRKGEESIEWDNSAPYEPLTIVLYQGNSYTSRQYVPAGVDINNNEFWAETGNYNAQVEQYRQETLDYKNEVENVIDIVDEINEELKSDFTYEVGELENCIYTLLTFNRDSFRVDLKLTEPNQIKTQGVIIQNGKTIPETAKEVDDSFITNINPSQNIYFENVLYGEDWTASEGTGTGFFGTTEDGEPIIKRGGNFSSIFDEVYSAIGTWQPIVRNGINEQINVSESALNNPNPFPVFAFDSANYYLLHVYGRFANKHGLSAAELQQFANDRNWPNAIIFDGGGSNCMCSTKPFKINSICLSSNKTWRTQYAYLAINER